MSGEGPRPSPLLLASLGVSGLALLLPSAFVLVGPLGAGALALLGHRSVRRSGGRLHGPRLAIAAMSAALLLTVVQAVTLWRTAPAAAAYAAMARTTEGVREALRRGTAESAWDLLGPEGRAAEPRDAFLARTRAASGRLGALVDLGEAREDGGDWRSGDAATFLEDEGAAARLGVAFDAAFERGRATVRIEILVRREGRSARASLLSLRVQPR